MAAGSAGRRLFFALWPEDELRDQIVSETQTLARDSGGRVIPPENLHVTLLFLGQVSQSQFAAVQQAGDSCANAESFELNFDRAEVWGRANLLCLTTSSAPAQATALAEKLRHALRGETLAKNEHEFRPHITLARDLPRRRRAEPIKPFVMKVNDFVLAESQPGPSGSRYSALARWRLLSSRPTPDPAVADRE